MSEWSVQRVELTRGTATYLESGDASAEHTLVLLHAFPVGVHMWEAQRIPDGWRAIAPAMPGFDGAADASRESSSIDDYAGSVVDLMDYLGVATAVVGGLSMGGYVSFALWRLAASRCQALVLADTKAGADTEQGRAGRQKALELVEREGVAGLATDMLPKLLGETTRAERPDVVRYVRALIERQTPSAIAGALRRLRDRPDATALLLQIDVPTLVLVGSEDTLTPPSESERMRVMLPQATLDIIEQAGHLSSLERPAAFDAALSAFLTTLP
jgi:pimeloyl-ACP methyl ester carboxylesterase